MPLVINILGGGNTHTHTHTHTRMDRNNLRNQVSRHAPGLKVGNQLPYIGNHLRKKTFVNFADFGMIANVFLLPFSIF